MSIFEASSNDRSASVSHLSAQSCHSGGVDGLRRGHLKDNVHIEVVLEIRHGNGF